MANLVFVTGDFCSGSTLLFTLFRQTGEYHCLYEPLHELLPEYSIWPLRVYEHHFFVTDYFAEYRGFSDLRRLFDPRWGTSGLYLPADAQSPGLYRYLAYIIDMGFRRRAKVMLKFNRATFRLPWLRARFPEAKVVHIFRDPERQWASNVRRAQSHVGRADIGQDSPTYRGFSMAMWCDDLKDVFPQLAVEHSRTGYERFLKLWELSKSWGERYADVSIDYRALTHDFEATCKRLQDCVGCDFPLASLQQFVIPPERQTTAPAPQRTYLRQLGDLLYRVGRRYAHERVKLERWWWRARLSPLTHV
jgi:hypothetical protein